MLLFSKKWKPMDEDTHTNCKQESKEEQSCMFTKKLKYNNLKTVQQWCCKGNSTQFPTLPFLGVEVGLITFSHRESFGVMKPKTIMQLTEPT